MLTEKDKEWLEKRAVESCKTCRDPDELFCSLCSRDPRPKSLSADFFSMSGCAMTTNWKDAAKFEARVAAIMPYVVFRIVAEQAKQKDITIDTWECLKLARLTVEEME